MTLRRIATRVGCTSANRAGCPGFEGVPCARVSKSMTKRTDDSRVVDPFDSRTWGAEDKVYFDAIDAALNDKDSRYISNGRPEHAAFLVHRFLTNAEETVRIYSGALSRAHEGVDVYGNPHIVRAAQEFLGKGGRIRVVVQNAVDSPNGERTEDHPFLRLVEGVQPQGEAKGSLVVKKEAQAFKEATSSLPAFHWMVMDESGYRLETDVKSAKAHANFGTPKVAMQLARLFDEILYGLGQPLFEWPSAPAR